MLLNRLVIVCLLALSLVPLPASFAQTFQSGFSFGNTGSESPLESVLNDVGELYLTGYFQGTVNLDPNGNTGMLTSAGSGDIFLAKYDAAGDLLWAHSLGGSDFDQGADISLDLNGNVYLAGRFAQSMDADPGAGTTTLTSNGLTDAFIACFKPDGSFVWAVSFGTPNQDEITSIAVFENDHLYVGGRFLGTGDFDPGVAVDNLTSNGGYDLFFSQFDLNGKYLWAKSLGTGSNEYLADLTVDVNSDLYLTAGFWGTMDFDPGPGVANLTPTAFADAFLAKYDKVGAYQWAFNVGGAGFFGSNGTALAADASGVYFCGQLSGSSDFDPGGGTNSLTAAGSMAGFIAKYDFNMNHQWAGLLNATSAGFTSVDIADVDLDGDGFLYVAGSFNGATDFDPGVGTTSFSPTGGTDGYLTKFSLTGGFQWAFPSSATTNVNTSTVASNRTYLFSAGVFGGTLDLDPNAATVNVTSAGGNDVWLGQYSNQPFPVEWAYFEAEPEEGTVQLTWGTHQEVNTDYFAIERSPDGRIFQPIGQIAASGNQTELSTYQFQDVSPLSGAAFYRIRQVDLDGRYGYSEVRQLTAPFLALQMLVFPNPAQEEVQFQLLGSDPLIHRAAFSLYNSLGARIHHEWIDPSQTWGLSLSYPPGWYTAQIRV
ncbi:MAG: hypothetical protein AAF399_11275, partial [Bacteroidota bacterium]